MIWQDHMPEDIGRLYEVHDYHHASAILAGEFPSEFSDLCRALTSFRFTEADVRELGGNESRMPKNFSAILRPRGWTEKKLTAKMVIDEKAVSQDTHKIDYVKGRVAVDFEWNSKDQTFDRDLYAFRTFFEYGKISVAVLVTRSSDLDPWFDSLGRYIDKHGKERTYKSKFGASTTHMGKLLSRLEAGRSGGCPILALGITTKLLSKRKKRSHG